MLAEVKEDADAQARSGRRKAAIPLLRDKAPTTPYGLRQGSKLPSRYRDEEPRSVSIPHKSPRTKTPKKPTADVKSEITPSKEQNESAELLDFSAVHNSYDSSSKTPSLSSQQRSTSTSTVSLYENVVDRTPELESEVTEEIRPFTGHHISQPPLQTAAMRRLSKLERDRDVLAERLGTKRLEHTLSLHKARRWTICEFFYSSIDEPLFLSDNEFSNILKEAFPTLKTNMLNKQQWRTIRNLLGKPRRCSPLFFEEEREALEQKRTKIRSIYNGTFFISSGYDNSDLPGKIPRALTVGNRVYARIHFPKDGIYSGTIDAVLKDGYRIIFEKEDMIPPLEVDDTQVMLDGQLDMVPISYFAEQVSAKLPFGIPPKNVPISVEKKEHPATKTVKKEPDESDKVGNFSVRMLVILVKLSKLIDLKKRMVRQLSELNVEAEKTNLLTNNYNRVFQEKYAQVVVDLETINKQMKIYMQGVQEYNAQLMQQLSEGHISLRAESIRKQCLTQAQQIVRKSNGGLNVADGSALSLITSLTSLLLQIRSLGQQTLCPIDLQMLSEAMQDIRSKISPKNVACFQDNVEVHLRQIHQMMHLSGAINK